MKKHKFIKFSISTILIVTSIFGLSLVVNAAEKAAKPKVASAKATFTGDKAKPLATIGNTVITVGQLEDRINKQIPFIRKRYTKPEELKKFIDSIVDFEVLAMEAKSKGYDKNPAVLKALKRVMIHRQRQTVLESRVKLSSITDVEVKNYFDKHIIEFKRPERRRAAIIVLKDKATADKVLADVKKTKGNLRQFQKLVKKYSIDEKTKKRGGLLPFFDVNNNAVEKSVITTTFGMKKAGDLAGPIKTAKGFAILRLSGVSPKVDKTIEKVSATIKKRLLKEKQKKAFKDYIKELKSKAKIVIHEDKLDLVKIDSSRRTMGKNFHNPRMGNMPGRVRRLPGKKGVSGAFRRRSHSVKPMAKIKK